MNQELYFKKLGKELHCAGKKRADILEDLRADVREAISQGESWEQVMERMGTPEELAGELNENMGLKGKGFGGILYGGGPTFPSYPGRHLVLPQPAQKL